MLSQRLDICTSSWLAVVTENTIEYAVSHAQNRASERFSSLAAKHLQPGFSLLIYSVPRAEQPQQKQTHESKTLHLLNLNKPLCRSVRVCHSVCLCLCVSLSLFALLCFAWGLRRFSLSLSLSFCRGMGKRVAPLARAPLSLSLSLSLSPSLCLSVCPCLCVRVSMCLLVCHLRAELPPESPGRLLEGCHDVCWL